MTLISFLVIAIFVSVTIGKPGDVCGKPPKDCAAARCACITCPLLKQEYGCCGACYEQLDGSCNSRKPKLCFGDKCAAKPSACGADKLLCPCGLCKNSPNEVFGCCGDCYINQNGECTGIKSCPKPTSKPTIDCKTVLCAQVVCTSDQKQVVLPGECCPRCLPTKPPTNKPIDCSRVRCKSPPACPDGEVPVKKDNECCYTKCGKVGCDTCKSGRYNDGCNDCFCGTNGLAGCTKKFCQVKNPAKCLDPTTTKKPATTINCSTVPCSQPQCKPGEVAITPKDECCPKCEDVGCDTCESGRYNDGCNDCVCGNNGLTACTKKFCQVKNPPKCLDPTTTIPATTRTTMDCSNVPCALPLCQPGQIAMRPKGECCPKCLDVGCETCYTRRYNNGCQNCDCFKSPLGGYEEKCDNIVCVTTTPKVCLPPVITTPVISTRDCSTVKCPSPNCDKGQRAILLPGACCKTCIPDCSTVSCAKPQCEKGEVIYVPKGECCPKCKKIKTPVKTTIDCSLVSCPKPVCGQDEDMVVPVGRCCPICRTTTSLTMSTTPDCSAVSCIRPDGCDKKDIFVPVGKCCPICRRSTIPRTTIDCNLVDCFPIKCEPGKVPFTKKGDCCPRMCIDDTTKPITTKLDCSAVSCVRPSCEKDEKIVTPIGKCCPECVKDCICTLEYQPVCCKNTKTFGNKCEARCNGFDPTNECVDGACASVNAANNYFIVSTIISCIIFSIFSM